MTGSGGGSVTPRGSQPARGLLRALPSDPASCKGAGLPCSDGTSLPPAERALCPCRKRRAGPGLRHHARPVWPPVAVFLGSLTTQPVGRGQPSRFGLLGDGLHWLLQPVSISRVSSRPPPGHRSHSCTSHSLSPANPRPRRWFPRKPAISHGGKRFFPAKATEESVLAWLLFCSWKTGYWATFNEMMGQNPAQRYTALCCCLLVTSQSGCWRRGRGLWGDSS